MTVPTRVLPALLLALASCSLAASPTDLAPKTDAECARTGQKACGYKCVSRDDPKTGCGNPGCSPCAPGGANMVASCDALDQCAYGCATGFADCNGNLALDGCEAKIAEDPANCGACWRSCGAAACSGGECAAESLEPWSEPRGIVSVGDVVYWVETGWYGNGAAYRWDPRQGDGRFVWGNMQEIASGLDETGSGAVHRLATAPGFNLFASGATAVGDLAIWAMDPAATASTVPVLVWSRPGTTSVSMLGLALIPAGIFFTVDADSSLHYVVDLATDGTVPTISSQLRGVTGDQANVYFGYDRGSLAYVDPTQISSGALELWTGLGSWPSRIAFFPDGPTATHVFWADESDGSVWYLTSGNVYRVDAGVPGLPQAMDIAADWWGVVWSSSAGQVRAWRASDERVFDLPAGGGIPRGVALTPSHIYWTEAPSAAVTAPAVLRVPK